MASTDKRRARRLPDRAGQERKPSGSLEGIAGGADQASRITGRFVAGPLVWGAIGWLLDAWLGTEPWLLATGVVFGAGAALYLVWRTTAGENDNEGTARTRRS